MILLLAAVSGFGQVNRLDVLKNPSRPMIAVPDFNGAGGAERYMGTFNATLWSELDNCGVLRMAPKSMYPLTVPQQPADLRQPPTASESMGGRWLTDWLNPPTTANYLAMGYTSVAADQIVLSGWLMSTDQPTVQAATLLAKRYVGPVSEQGARKVAAEFAADIMAQFGGKSLMGSKVYFISDRTGSKEVWGMNYDGTEQTQITRYNSLVRMPSVSPDGTKLAYTAWLDNTPQLYVQSLTTGRRLVFYNQRASLNMTADFLPNGSKMLFASSAGGGSAQIYMANTDGSGIQRVTNTQTIEVQPRVNPKTGHDIVFTSGRTGHPQIFLMSLEGGDIQELTPGDGEAVQASWSPDGKMIAFSWTHGFDIGNFNIFVMDVATKTTVQLTHGAGRNENPSWAPDGFHIVFSRKVGSKTQIYTMLADGSKESPLTTTGNNDQPVWSPGLK